MPETIELKNVIDEIISSYETRVQSISSLFDATYPTLNEFQESLMNAKQERDKVNSQLRDILAKNEHLRRKDFDNMIQSILQVQEEREREIRLLLKEYFNEEKTVAGALRENLGKFRDSLARGEVQRVKEFQALIKGILAKEEERKKEVTSRLISYQKEQRYLSSKPRELLAKGNELRIKDFKLMLKEIKALRDERLALQKKRKEEVAKMLKSFKEKRQNLPALSTTKKIYEERKGEVNIDAQGERMSKDIIVGNKKEKKEKEGLNYGNSR